MVHCNDAADMLYFCCYVVLVTLCSAFHLADEETEVTASQEDSSDTDDDDADDDDDDDDDNEAEEEEDEDDKEWMNEASDASPLDSSNVLNTRRVTVVYIAIVRTLSLFHVVLALKSWCEGCGSRDINEERMMPCPTG